MECSLRVARNMGICRQCVSVFSVYYLVDRCVVWTGALDPGCNRASSPSLHTTEKSQVHRRTTGVASSTDSAKTDADVTEWLRFPTGEELNGDVSPCPSQRHHSRPQLQLPDAILDRSSDATDARQHGMCRVA